MEKIKCQRCLRECDLKDIILSIKNGTSIDFFCKDCNALFGTCKTCKNGGICGFFNDPDPMPKFIIIQQKTQHENGYSIVQRQVPNTERLRKFCFGKCPCINETDPKDPYCCKFTEYTTCPNYCEQEYPKIVEDFSMLEAKEN